MNPLESDWFFQMIARTGNTPAQRLVAMYGITEQWIAAPGIREAFLHDYAASGHPMHACPQLKRFLANLAIAARIEKPEILANHLLILLQGAIVEDLRNPAAHALTEAAKAAQAVVANARRQPGKRTMVTASGIAAGLVAVSLTWHFLLASPTQDPMPLRMPVAGSAGLMPTGINPAELEATLALHEQIQKGACPAPQLLSLTPGQTTAYMNAINFRTPENPAADRENIRAFLAWYRNARATECYYPPVNGHTSVAWTTRESAR